MSQVRGLIVAVVGGVFALGAACQREPVRSSPPQPAQAAAPAPAIEQPKAEPAPTAPIMWRLPAPQRIIAVGDVHGDLSALRRALSSGGVIDDQHRWSAGPTLLVQTGDILDRGDQEQEIMDWLAALKLQAREQGGDVLQLLGNHETMNVLGDLRYVTPGGFKDFEDVPGLKLDDPRLTRAPEIARARLAAFLPGGPYAQKMASFPVVAIVGQTLFVHGSVTASVARAGLEPINVQTSAWLLGQGQVPQAVIDPDGPLWSRAFSRDEDATMCARLDEALKVAGVSRMVVGHTPQLQGITSACDGKVWRIDTGMASHYGGRAQVLEIVGDVVKPLQAAP